MQQFCGVYGDFRKGTVRASPVKVWSSFSQLLPHPWFVGLGVLFCSPKHWKKSFSLLSAISVAQNCTYVLLKSLHNPKWDPPDTGWLYLEDILWGICITSPLVFSPEHTRNLYDCFTVSKLKTEFRWNSWVGHWSEPRWSILMELKANCWITQHHNRRGKANT